MERSDIACPARRAARRARAEASGNAADCPLPPDTAATPYHPRPLNPETPPSASHATTPDPPDATAPHAPAPAAHNPSPAAANPPADESAPPESPPAR